jgi:hypothetical protein
MRRIRLPAAVATIYAAVQELNAEFPERSFTPDGHLVGNLGEVIAKKEFHPTLLDNSHPGHDAKDADNCFVQIKLTAKESIGMCADCDRLIVMKLESPEWAVLVYDGPGAPAWACAGKLQKNGQKSVRLSKLRKMMSVPGSPNDLSAPS